MSKQQLCTWIMLFRPLHQFVSFFYFLDGGSATRAIRLLLNNSKLSGQVEIYHSGSWEAICYDTWDIHDASVACRQLGYSGATGITRETPRASPVNGLNNLRCKGNENALGDCVRDWTSGSCGYGFAGVTCSGMVNFLFLTSTIFSFSIFSFFATYTRSIFYKILHGRSARTIFTHELLSVRNREIHLFCTLFVEELRSSNKKTYLCYSPRNCRRQHSSAWW